MPSVSLSMRAAAELELRRRQKMRVEAHGLLNKIPAAMTFREWCEKLATDPDVDEDKRLKVDGKPFRLDNRPALVPLYDAIPCTLAQAKDRILVIQKATQLGLTVWEVLANIYMAIKFGPLTIGMFLPDQATAAYKSEHRFMRMIRSVPSIYEAMTTAQRGGVSVNVGEGNVLTRTFGESIFLFLWTTGKVSTESRPMDVVTLDEVQEMDLAHIEKVLKRTGDSHVAFSLMLSTANMPDMDINYWFLLGDQHVWHSECESCGAFSDLSDPAGNFPQKSVVYNHGQFTHFASGNEAPQKEYLWCCPACAQPIEDPQIGKYIASAPRRDRRVESYLLPRQISPKNKLPREMVEEQLRAKTGDQRKSFYNRTLARPYIDVDQLPVTMAHCEAGARAGLAAGVTWEKTGNGYYMGIDQMGGFNAVIIKKRLPDGRQAVVWVEAVFGLDPFAECDKFMERYGIAVCVVEQLPNVNDARKFANRFPRRVFLAGYANLRDDAMQWGDQMSRSDKKTAEDDRMRYQVTLQQYRCMQTSLYRIRGEVREIDGVEQHVPMCLFPGDPESLEQDVIDNGVTKRIPLLRDWVWYHFTKTALIVEDDPETRAPKGRVQKVGIDPHYAFANMLCDVAWARTHGTGTIFLPTAPEAPPLQKNIADNMPGLASHVIKMVETLPPGQVCGRCQSFKEGMCRDRGFQVAPADPGCVVFVLRPDLEKR